LDLFYAFVSLCGFFEAKKLNGFSAPSALSLQTFLTLKFCRRGEAF